MKLPQEIDVWYIIPSIRREFTKRLLAKNLSQKDVAKMLDVTAAAVSQYLSEKRAKEIVFPEEISKELDNSVAKILKDGTIVMSEIMRLCKLIRKNGICCRVHREVSSDVPDKCGACNG